MPSESRNTRRVLGRGAIFAKVRDNLIMIHTYIYIYMIYTREYAQCLKINHVFYFLYIRFGYNIYIYQFISAQLLEQMYSRMLCVQVSDITPSHRIQKNPTRTSFAQVPCQSHKSTCLDHSWSAKSGENLPLPQMFLCFLEWPSLGWITKRHYSSVECGGHR